MVGQPASGTAQVALVEGVEAAGVGEEDRGRLGVPAVFGQVQVRCECLAVTGGVHLGRIGAGIGVGDLAEDLAEETFAPACCEALNWMPPMASAATMDSVVTVVRRRPQCSSPLCQAVTPRRAPARARMATWKGYWPPRTGPITPAFGMAGK